MACPCSLFICSLHPLSNGARAAIPTRWRVGFGTMAPKTSFPQSPLSHPPGPNQTSIVPCLENGASRIELFTEHIRKPSCANCVMVVVSVSERGRMAMSPRAAHVDSELLLEVGMGGSSWSWAARKITQRSLAVSPSQARGFQTFLTLLVCCIT